MNHPVISKILLLPILFTFLFLSCRKTKECPQYDHLGTLVWSAQTEAWLPKAYLQKPLTRVFQSGNGETKTFECTHLETSTGPSHFVDVPCPEHPRDTTRTYFNIKRLVARLMSSDSFAIDYSINIYNEKYGPYTEADFFEAIGISMNHFYDKHADAFGHVTVITDMRNAETDDIELYKVNNNKHFDELIVKGQLLADVYCDPDPEVPGANIYFRKGVGVVAYVDDQNILWTLVQ